MNEEESKYSFGRGSYTRDISSINRQEWNINKRASDQVRQTYRLSQGEPKKPLRDNFTEDDIGDEGITELFDYLSDSGSEESKHHSAHYFRVNSHMRRLEEASKSNDTGTFPFIKVSDEVIESKERSLIYAS